LFVLAQLIIIQNSITEVKSKSISSFAGGLEFKC